MAGTFEIRKEVVLDATPYQVWDAIATGPGLAAWFMPMELDPDSGTVLAWRPGQRLLVQTPTADDGSTQAFEYVLEPRAEGSTVLRFVHSGVLGYDWGGEFEPMTAKGWDMYLHTLAQYLRHFPGRRATYVEAEAPPASAAADAWPRLVDRLGGGAPLEVGTPVHIELAGVGSVDGEVDYVTPNFVGLRMPGALIRFHGRAPIGMPVAVSHHAYGDAVDADVTAGAWASWLGDLFA